MAATSMKCVGNLTGTLAHEVAMQPSSIGCRRCPSDLRANRDNSLSERTPWCAMHTSPGREYVPPPIFVPTSRSPVTDHRLGSRSVRYRVKLYARQAGITRKASPHSLRHAAITHRLADGANILKVKEMAGHASLATTQRYLHDLDALADNAVDYNPLTQV